MADPWEDEPDPLGDEVGDRPRWDRLVAQVGQRNGRLKAARSGLPVDTSPIMVDRFEVRRTAGKGAMGYVFEAFDTKLGRRVALKVCRPTRVDPVKDLEHEARCLAKLSHPNILAVHEILRVESDIVLVMEYVDGQTFCEWQGATEPSWRVVLDRLIEAGRALAAVHAAGLEHGDFKPSNVMIDHEGRVRVVDFGVARYSFEASGPDEADEIMVSGTPSYMPPERLLGKEQLPRKPGYPLADVYAFSVSVWESLFGVQPFAGETVVAMLESVFAGKFETRIVDGVAVPDAVREVLEWGLSSRPSERPQSMDELLRALVDAADGARARRARWRRRIERGLGLATAVASVFMAAMWMRAPELTVVVERGAPALESGAVPQPSAVALNLTLAVAAARSDHLDLALTYLELARKWAHADEIELREVAAQAETLGDEFDLRGETLYAQTCWTIAMEILFYMPDQATAAEHLRLKITMVRSR